MPSEATNDELLDRVCRAITEAYAAHDGAEKDVTFVPDAARAALKAAGIDTAPDLPQSVAPHA